MLRSVIKAADATAIGDEFTHPLGPLDVSATVQFSVIGTGAVTATIEFYGSNDQVVWALLNTISLSGTDSDTEIISAQSWETVKAKITALTGTDALAYVTICK